MEFFQLAAAWLFPCAVCATIATTAVTATDGESTVDKDRSPSPAFSVGGVKAGANQGSSPSPSSIRSSSSSSLLGTRCRSPNSGLSPDKHDGAEAAPKGDAVRQCLRRLAKKLQRAAGADDEKTGVRWERRRKSRSKTKPDTEDRRGARVVDGTTREREEAVAGAIAYCKETSSRRRSGTSPPPPSPSLDCWLMDRPEEEIGTACAAARCKCPGLRRDVSLLEWLPEAPACTPSAAVPHHCGYASCDDTECGGDSEADVTAWPGRGVGNTRNT